MDSIYKRFLLVLSSKQFILSSQKRALGSQYVLVLVIVVLDSYTVPAMKDFLCRCPRRERGSAEKNRPIAPSISILLAQ